MKQIFLEGQDPTLSGLCNWVFMNCPNIFIDQDNKVKSVPASSSCFLDFLWKK